jgi:hypothetical protein
MGRAIDKVIRAARAKGAAAAARGDLRMSPYGIDSSAARAYRRAWLEGYDAAKARNPTEEQRLQAAH